MESYSVQNLTFTYPGRRRPALQDICLTIGAGQFVTLIGPSGGGKTSLLKRLKPSLAPHGVVSGTIRFQGAPLAGLDARTETAGIGFVMQNPEQQIVTDKVWHELAFGLENLGYDTPSIRLRVAEMASFFGLQGWFHENVKALSGGQKQILCLASVMAMRPSVLILDEPTAHLDPIAASEFLNIVARINRELGVTVIMTEHRLDEVFPLSDRVVVMDTGRIIADGSPAEIGRALKGLGHGMCRALPVPMRVYAAVQSKLPCPVTVRDGRDWLMQEIRRGNWKDGFSHAGDSPLPNETVPPATVPPATVPPAGPACDGGLPAVQLENVWFRYEKDRPDVIKGLSFTAHAGQTTAVLGSNGVGKTTMLSLISGTLRPYRGRVLRGGNRKDHRPVGRCHQDRPSCHPGGIGVLPQHPQALFVGRTVGEDLGEVFAGTAVDRTEQKKRLQIVVALCRLKELLECHPYDLSGGEQQRAALAKVLLLEPRILLLDEPTKGMDAVFKLTFAGILRRLTADGVTVIIVSHDLEFCAEHADRCALFFDGRIVSAGNPRAFFSGHSFYTTAANRMAGHILPEAITAADIITALGDRRDGSSDTSSPGASGGEALSTETATHAPLAPHRRISPRAVVTLAVFLLVIPLTIYAGVAFLGDRKYLLISTLVLFEAMLPAALIFERRRPQAKELTIVAVLCALGVAGRLAFFMLPQFKPVLAIVIVAAVAFGAETGFLVGALTAFVSNLFLGQGPWTPWQMFAYGGVGALAGALFHARSYGRRRAVLAAFGGFTALFIYGPLVNASAVFTFQAQPTPEMFYSVFALGLPFDLMHAAATVVFLLLLARPLLEKLDRIKQKYGLMKQPERGTSPAPGARNLAPPAQN